MSFKQSPHWSVGKTDDEAPIPRIPPGVNPDMTDLAIRKVANDRLGAAYDIIRIGNLKPVSDPRKDHIAESLFPELAGFKTLAKIGVNKAYVEFSDGRTGKAVDDLLEGLKFSRAIFGSTLTTSLVSVAIQAIFLAEFERHLGQLSLADAVVIDRTCKSLIDQRFSVAEIYNRDYAMTLNSLDRLLERPSFLPDDQNQAFGPALKGLSDSDKLQLKDLVLQGLKSRYDAICQKLSGPESSWIRGYEEDDPLTPLDDKSISNLALAVVNALRSRSGNLQAQSGFAKGRIQLMLLRLHAKVIQFRWQNNRWPGKIDEFADAKAAIDPFTEEPFHYELKEGSYRLYSTGIPGIGPLELRYRALPALQTSDSNPPRL